MRTRNRLQRWTSLTLLAGLAACGGGSDRPGGAADTTASAAGGDSQGGELAYVTNEGSGELTIIDSSNDSVVGTIVVGTRPRGIRLSDDGRTVFVALSGRRPTFLCLSKARWAKERTPRGRALRASCAPGP